MLVCDNGEVKYRDQTWGCAAHLHKDVVTASIEKQLSAIHISRDEPPAHASTRGRLVDRGTKHSHGDVDELDKVPDETHDDESDGDGLAELGVLCRSVSKVN